MPSTITSASASSSDGVSSPELTPTRTFCSTCHAKQAADHYPQKECSACHFLTDPGAYRGKLTKTSG